MNAHDFLKQQHREVENAYTSFTSASGSEKEELGKKILTDLTVHAEIEEELYYPELEKIGEKDLVSEHTAEHQSAKLLIAELTAMDIDDERYGATMKALMEQIQHHIEEEETESMPKLESVLSESVLDDLGIKLDERSQVLHESTLKRLWATIT